MTTETRAEETESSAGPSSENQVVTSTEESAEEQSGEAEDVSLDELLLEGDESAEDDQTVTDAGVSSAAVDAALEQERHAAALAEKADLAAQETLDSTATQEVPEQPEPVGSTSELSLADSLEEPPTERMDEEVEAAVATTVEAEATLVRPSDSTPSDEAAAEPSSSSEEFDDEVGEEATSVTPAPTLAEEPSTPPGKHEAEESQAVLTDEDLRAAFESGGLGSLVEPEDVTTADRPTSPESIAARAKAETRRGDTVPLPSFQASSSAEPTAPPRSFTPPAMRTPEMSLEAMQEDEDDAVTHIGLALPDAAEPAFDSGSYASPAEYAPPMPPPAPDFRQSRSAETVVVPRIDPSMLPPAAPAPERVSTAPRRGSVALGWFSQLFTKSNRMPAFDVEDGAARKQFWQWVAGSAVFGLGLGALVMSLYQRGPVERTTQATHALQPNAGTEMANMTPLQKAQGGDKAAMAQLSQTTPAQRQAAETLALAEGEQVHREQEFTELLQELQTKSGDAVARADLGKRLAKYASDSATRFAALRAISEWPGSDGPDLIYSIWSQAPGGSETAKLAFDLLYAADVRAKSSAALQAALDLRAARGCEGYEKVLPRVVQHGDRRALLSLKPLIIQDGCGDEGDQDCYECLRDGELLERALAAAKSRPSPSTP